MVYRLIFVSLGKEKCEEGFIATTTIVLKTSDNETKRFRDGCSQPSVQCCRTSQPSKSGW